MRQLAGIVMLVVGHIGCDESSTGSGSSTMRVHASVFAYPLSPNARLSSEFETFMTVGIDRNIGRTDPDAPLTITITGASGITKLEFDSISSDTAYWTATATGYDELYELDIVNGFSRVEDVRVEGPRIHEITSPAPGTAIDASATTSISWETGFQAQRAYIEMLDESLSRQLRQDTPDTGSYLLTPRHLAYLEERPEIRTLGVVRENGVIPSGALEGSGFIVAVTNRINIAVQFPPQP